MLYYLRVITVFLAIAVSSLVFPLVFLFRPRNTANTQWLMSVLRPLCFKILGIKVVKENMEVLESPEAKVIVGNHQNNLDIFAFGCHLPRRTATIGKRSLLFIPFFGWLFFLTGQILINRKKRSSAIATLEKAKEVMLKKQLSIFMMPEGTRSWGKGLGKFKKGAFHMAIGSGFPVCPWIASSFHTSINLRRWRSGTIIIKALDPISTKGKTLDELGEIMKHCHETMEREIKKLDQRLLASAPSRVSQSLTGC